MKKYRILLILTLMATFLLVTTQALASSENTPSAKKTPLPVTPGAQATEKANDNATKQAGQPPHGKHENYRGIVAAVDSSSITLTLRDGSSVTVGLSADTRMKLAISSDFSAKRPSLMGPFGVFVSSPSTANSPILPSSRLNRIAESLNGPCGVSAERPLISAVPIRMPS